jgi:hypothetical protein
MTYQVNAMPVKFAKAFNVGDVNDRVDARGIWLAIPPPTSPNLGRPHSPCIGDETKTEEISRDANQRPHGLPTENARE